MRNKNYYRIIDNSEIKIGGAVSPYLSSNMYVIESDGEMLLIDPFYPCEKHIHRDTKIELILLTHEHYDHISGAARYREMYQSEIYCSYECAKRITNPRLNLSEYFDIFTSMPEFSKYSEKPVQVQPYTCKSDKVLKDNEEIIWKRHVIRVIKSPGHTIGSVCYLLDDKWMFSGDTLFSEIDTITRFPSGNEENFRNITLKRLAELSNDVIVFPGHFESFRLGERLAKLSI